MFSAASSLRSGLNYWYQLPSALPERRREMHFRRHEAAQLAGIGNISKILSIESISKKAFGRFLKRNWGTNFLVEIKCC
jgi:hypothetical protein